MPRLSIQIPEGHIYKSDNVRVTVFSDGTPAAGVNVTLDGLEEYSYTTDDNGEVLLYKISSGPHRLTAAQDGWLTAEYTFSVESVTYASSDEVRVQRSEGERRRSIADGKTILRFYYTPMCPNCVVMRSYVADIVNANRDCIAFEYLKDRKSVV